MLDKIQSSLNSFSNGNLTENAFDLFRTLGYESERQQPLDDKSFADFESYISEESNFNRINALADEWSYVDLLFQLTESELKEQNLLFDEKGKIDQRITSYLFFVIELKDTNYSRTKLSQITREVNKVFEIPVMILFKYGEFLTLSVINRRPNEKNRDKTVLEKVTLIKDIRFQNPHAAHRLILRDLSLPEIKSNYTINSFLDLHNAWQIVLDTKELNKRFFKELANWYFWAVENVTFPDDEEKNEDIRNATNVIRLITRLIFVWFLKEKGLVSEKLFDENYLKTILHSKDESAFYKAILQNLFFATLNSQMGERKFIGESSNGRNSQHFVHNVFRYKSEFLKPEETLRIFEQIPFLNGGLFECLDKETETDGTKCRVRVDGFSDNRKNVLYFPDELFFGAETEIDLNEIYGTKNKKYKVRGLINLLNSYKFTIAENTPIEEEIALDPELLGKVFENLLASYNPETKTTARKQTGSFYTPREIVNYMVDESLIAYLKAKLQTETEGFGGYVAFGENQPTMFGNEGRIQQKFEMSVSNNRWHGKEEELEVALRDLFSYSETTNKFNETETEILIKAIDNCKILDPACGSGAFPMGILQRLVFLLKKLDVDNAKWREWQERKAKDEAGEAFKITDQTERDERLKEISDVFENNQSDYGRKLFLIENCIYGVDIQPIAIQIAKLRFFISLIVDEKTNAEKENLGIRPLPNLETKFVAANTLIGLEAQGGLKPEKAGYLEKDLKEVRAKHFSAKTRKTKEKYREKDKEIRLEIADLLKQGGIKADIADQIAKWNPYDQNASADWFDAEYMFGIEKGFDIIIGNPPYIRQEQLKYLKPILEKQYDVYNSKSDLYTYFYELTYKLAKVSGISSFITNNTWIRGNFGKRLRTLFLEKTEISQIINFQDQLRFAGAIVETNILIFRTTRPKVNHKILYFDDLPDMAQNKFSILQKKLRAESFTLENPETLTLKNKIENNSPRLKDWNLNISMGLRTGLNQAFYITSQQREFLVNRNEKNDTLIKPILRGRDIKRYSYFPSQNWVIITKYNSHNEIENNHPEIFHHLSQFREDLENRGQCRYGGKDNKGLHHWLELDNCPTDDYLREFTKPKIIWIVLSDKAQFAYDEQKLFINNAAFMITGADLKYVLSILNSKVCQWYFDLICPSSGMGTTRWEKIYVEQIPIAQATEAQKKEIIVIVDEIIEAKKQNPNVSTKDLEAEIDRIVYELYTLTDEEICIVQGEN